MNLSQFRSFAFLKPASPSPSTTTLEQSPAGQTIRDEIARDLTAKGVMEATQGPPDFLVAYHVKLTDKLGVTDWGYGPGFWGGMPGDVTVDEYTQGTIIVDFIDPRTKTVFWRGTATEIVDSPNNPDTQKVAAAVDKLMKKYPAEVATAPAPRPM